MHFIIYFLMSVFLFYTSPLLANATNEADALHLDWIDKNIDKSKNFFGYANGNWQKNNPIPPDYPSWDAFYVLQKHNQEIVRNILEKAEKDTQKPNSLLQKVGDFYYSGMNVKSIEKEGINPLKPELEAINKIKNK